MMIETELKALVQIYASYDKEKKYYSSSLNRESLLRLDNDFIRLINKLLLNDGPDKLKIQKNYRKLALFFHPDHKDIFSSETKWIEQNLSEDKNDGACFRTLGVCYEKLIAPEEYKPIEFDEISTLEDLKKWLNTLKVQSKTFTERSFYANLLGLLEQSSEYFDEVGKIKPKGIRLIVSLLPLVFISFGTFVFSEQLFTIYAFYFVLLKSGQFIEEGQSTALKKLGSTLQQITVITASTTTTLLVGLLEMTFWASRQCYDVSLKIGSSLLTPLITVSSGDSKKSAHNKASACRDLILARQDLNSNDNFRTPELKMIAAPIEHCLGLLDQQFFKNWRAGGEKYRALHAFLFRLRVIDKDEKLSSHEKVIKAHASLQIAKRNPVVYSEGGNTALAIDRAERVISMLHLEKAEFKMTFI